MNFQGAQRRARNKNAKNQMISVKSGVSMPDLLFQKVWPGNLLLDGEDSQVYDVLEEWVIQLFARDETQEEPVVVLSPSIDLLREIIAEREDGKVPPREVYFFSEERPRYDLFLGMEETEIIAFLSDHVQNVLMRQLPGTVAFSAVARMLEDFGYEQNLENLLKVFSLSQRELSQLLLDAGETAGAHAVQNDEVGEHAQMRDLLQEIQKRYRFLWKPQEEGTSLSKAVQVSDRYGSQVPFFYFCLPAGGSGDFLDLLAQELRWITRRHRVHLIFDNVSLGGSSSFCEFLCNPNPNLHLTLAGISTVSLLPSRKDREVTMQDLDGYYQFCMILCRSGNDPRPLCGHRLGEYERITVDQDSGVGKGFFKFLPDNKHEGWKEGRQMLDRIRHEQLASLRDRECFLLFPTDWSQIRYRF